VESGLCPVKGSFHLKILGMYSILEKLSLKPHCIRCCHFKVDDVSALEAVRIVEDNIRASLH
jgi:hypothetical protein